VTEPRSVEGATLAGQIAEIPEDALRIIRNGYSIAAALTEEKRQQAIELLIRQIQRAGGSLDTEIVATATGLSRRDASRVNAALSLMVGLLTDTAASASDFISAGLGKIFDASQATTVEAIAEQLVRQRSGLQKSMARGYLGATVLPSLTRFDVAVDLRFKFAEDQIEDRVAVALMHIATDSRSQSIWLQLSRNDVERIIEKLTKTLKQMDLVENIVKPPPKEGRE
jgi:hypothetical protein